MQPSSLLKIAGLWCVTHLLDVATRNAPAREGYYIIRPAARSYSIAEVGKETTVCPGNSRAASCRLTTVDLSRLGREINRDAEDSAFTYGYALAKAKMGTPFVVTELWRPLADARPLGIYYRVRDSGIRCIKAPCNSLVAEPLDGTPPVPIVTLDLDALDVRDSLKRNAMRALGDGSVMVAGTLRDDGARGGGRTLVATQLFTPVGKRVIGRPPNHSPAPPAAS